MNAEERLLSTVEKAWGLRVRSARKAPGGEAMAYVLDAGRGRYFLKVYDPSRQGSRSRARLDRVLPLTRALSERGISPAPVEARDGRLFHEWEDRALVLFEWIEGVSPDPMRRLDLDTWRRLARTIARVHRITPEIPFSDGDDFDVPSRRDLRDCLDAPGPLGGLLEPRADEIREVLDLLDDLGARFRSGEPRRVLTHGDLHGGNLVRSEEDELYVLDWDDALLAPPERDLAPFVQGDRHIPRGAFREFLGEYEGVAGPVELDPDVLRFYLYRRNLDDLTVWLVRILRETRTEKENARDVAMIESECLSWLSNVETYVDAIR